MLRYRKNNLTNLSGHTWDKLMAVGDFSWIYLIIFLAVPLARILPRVIAKIKKGETPFQRVQKSNPFQTTEESNPFQTVQENNLNQVLMNSQTDLRRNFLSLKQQNACVRRNKQEINHI